MKVFDNYDIEPTQVGTDLCKEKWKFTTTSEGCVLLNGKLTRKFKTADPYNIVGAEATKQDLDLDYVSY